MRTSMKTIKLTDKKKLRNVTNYDNWTNQSNYTANFYGRKSDGFA